jgi:hypothetical protein
MAEALVDELRPFFFRRYGRFAGPASPKLGDKVQIRAVAPTDFARDTFIARKRLSNCAR